MVDTTVNGHPMKGLMDVGTSASLISQSFASLLSLKLVHCGSFALKFEKKQSSVSTKTHANIIYKDTGVYLPLYSFR